MLSIHTDEHFMNEALKEAQKAFDAGEVPVGAVVVAENQIIARGHNQTELLTDVTAHAEILAMTSAANALGAKYINECRLFVTLEPCVMCAGASYWSQIGGIIIVASDPERGYNRLKESVLHPKTTVTWGVKEQECSQILLDFFKNIRQN